MCKFLLINYTQSLDMLESYGLIKMYTSLEIIFIPMGFENLNTISEVLFVAVKYFEATHLYCWWNLWHLHICFNVFVTIVTLTDILTGFFVWLTLSARGPYLDVRICMIMLASMLEQLRGVALWHEFCQPLIDSLKLDFDSVCKALKSGFGCFQLSSWSRCYKYNCTWG